MKHTWWLALALIAANSISVSANTAGRIVNNQTGFVMGVMGGSTAEGALVVTWHSDGTRNQTWTVVPTDAGWFKIVNLKSGLCMGVYGASTGDGAGIVQWHCDGTLNQAWRWEARGYGRSVLVNRGSGKVVGVLGASTLQGSRLVQWHEVRGAPNQLWHFSP